MIIYRLENYKGNGPFHATQGMVSELVPHYDPTETKMLHSSGICLEEFERITDCGAVFGWEDSGKMLAFFKDIKSATKTAARMRFKISVYESNTFFRFLDGQVLFLRYESPLCRYTLKELSDNKIDKERFV